VNRWAADTVMRVGPPVLRALARTWRFTEVSPTDGSLGPPVRRAVQELYALWHQQLLMLTLLHRDRDIAVMISLSRDGAVASRVVEQLGFRIVRGSSSRGGAAGLREMIEATGEGHPLALTVDGPRGPARRCKPGAIVIAGRARLPIVPTVAIPLHGRALNSWDRFLVPAPRSRIFVSYGNPIHVRTDESTQDIKAWQSRVDSELDRLVQLCESAAGKSWPRSRDA
jgi:lysophospholipid acyltransferase (LPLAT)-like uncharacterized protein